MGWPCGGEITMRAIGRAMSHSSSASNGHTIRRRPSGSASGGRLSMGENSIRSRGCMAVLGVSSGVGEAPAGWRVSRKEASLSVSKKCRTTRKEARMSRTLIKGGCVVTMDPQARDLPQGDVLIETGRIAAIGPVLDVPAGAELIDAAGMIGMPGLVNGHVHTWQSGLRGIAADWTVAEYMQAMHRGLATLYRPEDIYIANLMGALNQINGGATTLVDWCHNNRTPEHTDAAIDGLAESGIRAVFLHGSPKPNPKPGQKHFSESPLPHHEIDSPGQRG